MLNQEKSRMENFSSVHALELIIVVQIMIFWGFKKLKLGLQFRVTSELRQRLRCKLTQD